jgi:hypothetical protein
MKNPWEISGLFQTVSNARINTYKYVFMSTMGRIIHIKQLTIQLTYSGAWNKYKYFFEGKYFSTLEIRHREFTDIHRKFTDIHRKQRNNGAFTKCQ